LERAARLGRAAAGAERAHGGRGREDRQPRLLERAGRRGGNLAPVLHALPVVAAGRRAESPVGGAVLGLQGEQRERQAIEARLVGRRADALGDPRKHLALELRAGHCASSARRSAAASSSGSAITSGGVSASVARSGPSPSAIQPARSSLVESARANAGSSSSTATSSPRPRSERTRGLPPRFLPSRASQP